MFSFAGLKQTFYLLMMLLHRHNIIEISNVIITTFKFFRLSDFKFRKILGQAEKLFDLQPSFQLMLSIIIMRCLEQCEYVNKTL